MIIIFVKTKKKTNENVNLVTESRCHAKNRKGGIEKEIKQNKYTKTKRERYPYNLGDSASLPSFLCGRIYRSSRFIFVSIKYHFSRPTPRLVAVSFTQTVFHVIPPSNPFLGGGSNRPCRMGLSFVALNERRQNDNEGRKIPADRIGFSVECRAGRNNTVLPTRSHYGKFSGNP